MATTYSTNLKLSLMGVGDQSGTWGDTNNTNLGTLLEEAVAGYATQALTGAGPTALAITDGVSSTGRNYVIEFTGTPTAGHTVTVPAVEKPYIFFNNTNIAIIVKVSGQTGVTIAVGKKAIVYTNATDVIEVANAPVTEAGTQTLTNKTLTSPTIATPTITTSATVPTIYGGTAASSSLTLQSTSGVGTTDEIIFKTGNNIQAMRIRTDQNITIGSTVGSGSAILGVTKTMVGAATSRGIEYSGSVDASVVTTNAYAFNAAPDVGTGTLPNLVYYRANQGTFTGTVTTQAGFVVSSTLTGATTNYGFQSNLNSGANIWGFYASGTAANAFTGDTRIGSVVAPTKTLDITGTLGVSGAVTFSTALPATSGGTGLSSYTIGDLLYASTTTALSRLLSTATGSVLVSAGFGAPPSYSASPTLTTSLTTPLLIGGTTASSSLTLQSTSGVGTSDSIAFKVGNNGGVEAMRIDSSGIVTGTAGNLMLVQGTSQTVTATGTAVSFSGIPSWVKRITFLFADLAVSGTSPIIIQLGSTTYSTSGYLGGGVEIRATPDNGASGLGLMVSPSPVATDVHNGIMIISKLTTANIWVSSMSAGQGSASQYAYASGGKSPTLSGVLDRVQITTVAGTGTFTGTFNIHYE